MYIDLNFFIYLYSTNSSCFSNKYTPLYKLLIV